MKALCEQELREIQNNSAKELGILLMSLSHVFSQLLDPRPDLGHISESDKSEKGSIRNPELLTDVTLKPRVLAGCYTTERGGVLLLPETLNPKPTHTLNPKLRTRHQP